MSPQKTTRRVDPVCGTCRKKCRKCDRTKPECKRCISQGLVCEGYPLNIKMYGMEGGALRKSRPRARQEGAPTTVTTRQASRAIPQLATEPETIVTNSPDELAATSESSWGTELHVPVEYGDGLPLSTSNLKLRDDDDIQGLLLYYENVVCPKLSVTSESAPNPFKTYILPLALQDVGLLRAVLGLTACHLATQQPMPNRRLNTAALEYRVAALQSLSALLLKEECFGLSEAEEETALAIVLMLVLHDTFECGRSNHGAHLNGVAFLCSRLAERSGMPSPSQMFLVTALTWFDLLRGFSGAEKLVFPQEVRRFVANSAESTINSLVGCPAEVFLAVGDTLALGKDYLAQELEEGDFQISLDSILLQLQSWDPLTGHYPNTDPAWIHLADAYRHMAILRVLRFPDPYTTPCSDSRIRASVDAILDATTLISRRSPYFKRLLFPLFVAGAETASPHQQQYVVMCVENIKEMTGVTYHSVTELLEKTWKHRRASDGSRNVPWHDYTCSKYLPRQHDYLFF
ncbi:hypothetical protein P171DRAFT_456152 [Karstenula rhodostoma CBS 690.94]|uniref:Zn(2)-C6 fungal-type domain-containing protein n=1 Tax=Karstenula rhodostoma CBS 690.94 TaxID=1392251 RepID=A0A9P4PFK4_9PLEO|nr:hypothetical protein P171DRAFT_456152 [Karstenula rhodostoma CBS 690.94]